MESAGLVTREGCPSDGRGSMAVLTREGREAMRRAAPVHLRGIQEHFAGYLTDSDVVAMHRALAKLPGVGTSRGS
jgi:DNA-binding MarR family transcriptional regulator